MARTKIKTENGWKYTDMIISNSIDFSVTYNSTTGVSDEIDTRKKWFNGKKIYTRFYKIPKESVSSRWVEIANQYINKTTIDNLISINGCYNNTMILNSGATAIDTYTLSIAELSNNGFMVSKGNDVVLNADVYVVFEYTKNNEN